ncbi:MAG: peptidase [Alphaproteobacteria bacterium]
MASLKTRRRQARERAGGSGRAVSLSQVEDAPFGESRAYLRRIGYPQGDDFSRPSSKARFPDGAHFRVEVPTVNSADSVATLVRVVEEEAGVKINRIDQTQGIMRFSDKEHQAYLDVGRERGIEIFFALGPRGTYDTGAQKMVNTVWGHASALRTRGMEQVVHAMEDMKRITRMGGRGLLISDEGMLILAQRMRADGVIPPDVRLMASAHMGHNNPVSFRLLEELGADTIATQRDLEMSMLASMRRAVRVPLHVHIDNPQATGGFIRVYDAPEMIRICAPVYLKTGSSVLERHGMTITDALALAMARQVAVSMETIRRHMPRAVQTARPAKDMAIPV